MQVGIATLKRVQRLADRLLTHGGSDRLFGARLSCETKHTIGEVVWKADHQFSHHITPWQTLFYENMYIMYMYVACSVDRLCTGQTMSGLPKRSLLRAQKCFKIAFIKHIWHVDNHITASMLLLMHPRNT